VSVAVTVALVVDALTAAGLRVAQRDGDITPPVTYIRIGQGTNGAITLAGGTSTVLWVYVIPVRGVDNLAGDADLLDIVITALEPLAAADLPYVSTTLNIRSETWPCYRFDLTVLETTPPGGKRNADNRSQTARIVEAR
jgi:hypothetical protein